MTTKTASRPKATKPSHPKVAKPAIFIDGEAGTTGLEIRAPAGRRCRSRGKSIAPDKRKDEAARLAMMRQVDLVVLCLPDDAAKEAVALIDALGADGPKVIDASTAHRVAPGWVYGFPEMDAAQAEAVRKARRVSNPGCYPTAAIALIRPLVEAGLHAGRLSRHHQCGQRLQRRRAQHDRGLRGRHGAGLRALWPRLRAQAPARAADITPS